jgi:hypothetical protein
MSQVSEYVQREVLELVKRGVDVTPSMITRLRKDFINHRNNYNNKILACVDAQIYNHRIRKTKVEEKVVTVDLGYKNESYLTEEEMINGYIVPKYSELSIAEKEIWKTK